MKTLIGVAAYGLVAMAAGFVGGLVAGQLRLSVLPSGVPPAAPVAVGNPDVVTAHKFAIVDSNGKTRAVFSADAAARDQAKLVFYDASGRPVGTTGRPAAEISGDGLSVGDVVLGPTGLGIGSADGSRSSLGSGFLLIANPSKGTAVNIIPTSITLRNSDNRSIFEAEFLHVHKGRGAVALDMDSSDNPSLALVDEQGRSRAQFGSADLEEIGTGTKIHRSPASLVLFKEDGRVLWEAP